MSSETLDYAGLGSARGLEFNDDGHQLVIVQRTTLMEYAVTRFVALGLLGPWAALIYVGWITVRRIRFELPVQVSAKLSADGLFAWSEELDRAQTAATAGARCAPLHRIAETRKNRFERGVWIDAPGYIKGTYFKGRKDDQAIADTLNRRLQQLRDAAARTTDV